MKRTEHKKFTILASLLCLFGMMLYLSICYILDPAGVNGKFYSGIAKESEYASRTVKYVEMTRLKPDTVILGGSRVYFLDTNDIKKHTKNNVYNIGLSCSTLEEQYLFLKYAVEELHVKNVVIGLNLYPFSENIKKCETDFDENIFENGLSLEAQMKHYLEVPILKYAGNYLQGKLSQPLYENGARTAFNQSLQINDKAWSVRSESSLSAYRKTYDTFLTQGNSGLALFKKMVDLCKDNNVNLNIFTTVIHDAQLKLLIDNNKLDMFYYWKKELARITPYWDFMYPNQVSKDSTMFIDTSHIKQENGHLYFDKIFGDNTIPDNNFGKLVNSINVNKHISFLHERMNTLAPTQ